MKKFLWVMALGLCITLELSCDVNEDEIFTISSSSFTANGPLPAQYTCDGKAFGEGIAPELHWTAGPKSAQSYAIVFKDLTIVKSATPDRAFHWMIWNIPVSTRSLPEGLPGDSCPAAMNGALQRSGRRGGGFGYFGPCPSWMTYCSGGTTPAVVDTYSFTLYAFNSKTLTLPSADTTIAKNYIRQTDNYFTTMAIAKAEIKTTSGAVPDTFACPPASTK
jgi:phosphatidylethanolamine-binding protein (PEBP) family uncharacterized protein